MDSPNDTIRYIMCFIGHGLVFVIVTYGGILITIVTAAYQHN